MRGQKITPVSEACLTHAPARSYRLSSSRLARLCRLNLDRGGQFPIVKQRPSFTRRCVRPSNCVETAVFHAEFMASKGYDICNPVTPTDPVGVLFSSAKQGGGLRHWDPCGSRASCACCTPTISAKRPPPGKLTSSLVLRLSLSLSLVSVLGSDAVGVDWPAFDVSGFG